jgi:hypothetical protein
MADDVSFIVHAQEILAAHARDKDKGSGSAARQARMVLRMDPLVIGDLAAEGTPYRIARWVAGGGTPTGRRQRADLVLHLRRTIETARNGWILDVALGAAYKAWRRVVDDARRRGLPQPRPCDLPTDTYVTAMASVEKRKRRKSPASASGPTSVRLSAQEWAMLRQQLQIIDGLFDRAG